MQSIFEKLGGTYSKEGDYYIPDLIPSKDEERLQRPLGMYGMLRRTYLKEHRQAIYNHLLLSGKLYSHLHEVDEQAQHLLDTLIPPMKKAENVTEELKANQQMEWIGKMNNIKARIEEIIYVEIVYQ